MTKYVRAGDLLVTWKGPNLVLSQIGRASRVLINMGYMQVLEAFEFPMTLEEFEAIMAPQVPEGSWDAVSDITGELIDWGALLPSGVRPEELFFDTFSAFTIHNEMLKDGPRLSAYAEAIAAQVKPGDVVIDAGTGTGVLAMLAARAGASRVYAVDRVRGARMARRLVEDNGLTSRIEFIDADIDDFNPKGRADVIVSETFGSLGSVEGGLASLASLAKRALKPGGALIPRGLGLHAAPLSAPKRHTDTVGVWGAPIAGLDFSALQSTAYAYGRSDEAISPDEIAAPPVCFSQTDLLAATCPSLEGQVSYTLPEGACVDGIGFYFVLDMGAGVVLRTGFDVKDTHWHQIYVPIPPMQVGVGGRFTLKARLEPSEQEVDLHCATVDDTGVLEEHRRRVFVR